MRTRVLSAATALILGLVLLAGCSSDNDSEWQRVVCEVELVNEGGPLVAAYVQDGGDGIIGIDPVTGTTDDEFPFDSAAFMFRARPYSLTSMTIPEDDAYSSFIITGYNLTWRPSASVPAGLDMSLYNVRDGAFYLQVPLHDDAISAVMISDRLLQDAIINAQGAAWPMGWADGNDFTAIADIEFIGHDSGSKHETLVETGVSVFFTYAIAAD